MPVFWSICAVSGLSSGLTLKQEAMTMPSSFEYFDGKGLTLPRRIFWMSSRWLRALNGGSSVQSSYMIQPSDHMSLLPE